MGGRGVLGASAVVAGGIAALSLALFLSLPSGCSQIGTMVLVDAGPPDQLVPEGVVVEPAVHPVVQITMNAIDPGGTGANTKETYLNVTNVNPTRFGKLFTREVDGDQFAQPLYMGGLVMADGRKHNVIFLSTSHDSVYAYDADDADDVTGTKPLWKVSLGTSTLMPSPYLSVERACNAGPCCNAFGLSESGITGTPAIDPETNTMYVVALNIDFTKATPGGKCVDNKSCKVYTCDAPKVAYFLHALDIITGNEKYGGPVELEGTVSGSGGGNTKGKISFDAGVQLVRPALLVANHNVYIASGSYADVGAYHGWVFAYDETTLKQVGIFNDTRDGGFGGIWQSGRGILSDGKGSVYVVSGNGTFDANKSGHDYGDSVLKLSADLREVQSFFSQQLSDYQGENYLSKWDGDLGSAGATLIPGTELLLASGKMGFGFLLDTQSLGGWSPVTDNAVQKVRITWRADQPACDGGDGGLYREWAWVYNTPVVWKGPDGMHVYVWANGDVVRDYLLDGNGMFTDSGQLCFCKEWVYEKAFIDLVDPNCAVVHTEGSETAGPETAGGTLSVSSNGAEPGTGILWATRSLGGFAIHFHTPGVIEAYDATNLKDPIWSSNMVSNRDKLGDWAKFSPPVVANGKVYAPTFSKELVVYGLLADR
jgi:hypothetical protein